MSGSSGAVGALTALESDPLEIEKSGTLGIKSLMPAGDPEADGGPMSAQLSHSRRCVLIVE